MQGQWVKLLPLALSTGALICLAIVFASCTSPSSPSDLYFLKVNLSAFPNIEKLDLRRSIGLDNSEAASLASGLTSAAGGVTNTVGAGATQVSSAIQTGSGQVSANIQSLSDDLKSYMPGYYSVGLWGYCQGQGDTMSTCTKPSAEFFFNLSGIFSSAPAELKDLIPGVEDKVLAGYRQASQWSISAYTIGFTLTVVTTILGIIAMTFSWAKIPLVISSILAAMFTTGGSIGVTVIYSTMNVAIKSVLHSLGAQSGLGARMFAATWLAVSLSSAAMIIWLVMIFCCGI